MTTKTDLSPENLVCPQCGMVITNNTFDSMTHSVSMWECRGHKVEKCYYCKRKEASNGLDKTG